MDFKIIIEKELKKIIDEETSLEIPPNPEMGDYAFPCFTLSKKLKKSPIDIAKELEKKIKIDSIEVKSTGPYLNFFINKNLFNKQIITSILNKEFIKNKIKNEDKTIIIDFSAPNVAKHMGIHNLRSTVIGQALYNLYKSKGYQVIGINHLGDWGTNFGQLIVGIKMFSSLDNINHVKDLNKIYVKFHEEAEKKPNLMDLAREEFTKLENGDLEAKKYWEKFVEISLKDYNKIYNRLNITFDEIKGESEYIEHINYALKILETNKLTKIDDGALVVDVGNDMPPCLLKKKDGSTLYGLRDITAGLYRLKEYNPYKILYVVDIAQALHFKQWFKVMELIEPKYKTIFEHIIFGRLSFKDGSMSTRKGKVVILEEVLDKAKDKVKKIIMNKNPNLKNKDDVAEMVGSGAIVFNDLFNDRLHNIIFDWDKILDFEGDTGPYVQYTFARCCAILRKSSTLISSVENINFELIKEVCELNLIKNLSLFDSILDKSIKDNKPSHLAKYLINLSRSFNAFYGKNKIICDDKELTNTRISLVKSTKIILKKGLNILNIKHPEEM